MVRGLTRDVIAPHNGARAVPAGYDAWGGGRHQMHRGKRRRNRSRQTSVTSQLRQTRNAKADAEVGWRVEPASSVDRRRRTEDGAPYDV